MRLLAILATCLVVAVLTTAARAVDVQQFTSDQGIEVWLVEDHTVPMVAMNFAFRGGTTQDRAGAEGAAKILSYMLDEGAGPYTSKEFQERMEDLSVNLWFSASKEYFSGSLVSLTSTLPEAIDLMTLALNEPRFDDVPLARIKSQVLVGLESAINNPSDIVARAMAEAAFPDHPYARDSDGEKETVATVDAAELRSLHKKIFARQHLKIAVVGAIDQAMLSPMIDQMFGGLPIQSGVEEVAVPQPLEAAELFLDRDLAQARISFIGPGYRPNHPDALTAFVLNHIFGGSSFTSRLFDELREKRGLVYSASSRLSSTRTIGTLAGGLGTQSSRARHALEVLQQTMADYAQNGPSAEELASAKKYLIGNFPLRFTTTGSIASELLSLQITGRTTKYWEERADLINAVTLEDAQRVAKQMFDPDKMIFVVLGAS